MKIVITPNPILTTPAREVASIDKKIKKLVAEMEITLVNQTDPEGVGLAAPQVGYPLRLFITKPTPKAKLHVFINPQILKHEAYSMKHEAQKKQKSTKLEGCLSIPRIWGHVERPTQVLLAYTDLNGLRHEKIFKGFEATIIDHEIDHLNGVLFTQRVLEQSGKLYREEEGELKEYKI